MSQTYDQDEAYVSDDGVVYTPQYSPNGLDDYDIDYIPNSYLDEQGIRHCVVWDLDEERRYKWDAEDNRMILNTDIF